MEQGETLTRGRELVSARSLVEAAYGALRRDIINGVLAPGSKLRVEALKETYNIGASTLREALTRLVGEALVTSEEQRGFWVAPISLADFADLTRTRGLIEVEALRLSIENGDDNWEASLVAAYHRLSKVDGQIGGDLALSDLFEERNREFHRALIAACPSRWLLQLQSILFQQSERYRRLAVVKRPQDRDVHAEHSAIVEAALARDVELACRLESEHINRTLDVLNESMALPTPASD